MAQPSGEETGEPDVGGTGVVLVGIVGGSALALVAETYLARSLAPSVYGSVALAYTMVYAIGLLIGNGIADSVARTLSESDGPSRATVVGAGVSIAALLGTGLFLAGYLSRTSLAALLAEPSLTRLLPWLLPFLVLYPLGQVAFSAIRARTDTKAAVLVRDFGPRLVGIVTIGVASMFGANLIGAVAYWLVFPTGILVFGFGYLFSQDSLGVVQRPSTTALSTVWSHAWPLAAAASMFMLLSTLDVLMIGYFLSSSEVGFYRAIQPLRQATTFVMSAFSFAFLPVATRHFTAGRARKLANLFRFSTKWVVAATLPLALTFVLYADSVVTLLFGSAYAPSAPALAVLTAGLFFRTLTGLDGDLVKAIDRPKVELWTSAVGVSVNVVLNMWLIPRFGIVGAAVGTAVGYAVYNALELAVIYRAVGIHPFSRATAAIVTVATVGGVAVRTLTGGQVAFPILAIAGFVIGLATLVSALSFGTLSKPELVALERVERRSGLSFLQLIPASEEVTEA